MKSIRIGSGAGFANDRFEPAVELLEKGNLDYLCHFFEEYVPKIKVIRPEGSYLVWLDCRGLGMTPEELKEFFLKKAKVAPTFGETYGEAGEGFERLNIGCPRKTLEDGLNRIRDAVKALG